jgi:NADPH:quinone reductase-like Zn-dependent oxidoreductase
MVQHGYGAPPDVLQLADVEMPIIGAQDVLVSVRGATSQPSTTA